MRVRYDRVPCPFCKSTNTVVKHWGREGKMFVNCRDCLACGPAEHYTEDAVAAWNRSKATCDAVGEPTRCSACGHRLTVDSQDAGENHAYCPGCGAEINPPRLF